MNPSSLLIMISLLFLPEIIYADVIPPQDYIFSSNWITIGFNFIINYLILGIGSLIIKRKDLLKTKKFIGYVLGATIGAWLIELVPWEDVTTQLLDPHTDPVFSSYRILVFFLAISMISLLIAIYNYWLAKILFKLPRGQLIFISVFMAIFTSPFLIMLISWLS